MGEGDILELAFEHINEKSMSSFCERIKKLNMGIKIGNDSVLIRHISIIEYLPAIRNIAENEGLRISEIRLRENTLEDVFINLTGRNRRQ